MTEHAPTKPKLWNPNAAGCWSGVLSPAFGAILVAINWSELGHEQNAKTNKIWAWVTISFFLVFGFLLIALWPVRQKYWVLKKGVEFIVTVVGTTLFATWYVSEGRRQAKFVKETFGKEYEKRKWCKPLLMGIGGAIVYLLYLGVVTLICMAAFGLQIE